MEGHRRERCCRDNARKMEMDKERLNKVVVPYAGEDMREIRTVKAIW